MSSKFAALVKHLSPGRVKYIKHPRADNPAWDALSAFEEKIGPDRELTPDEEEEYDRLLNLIDEVTDRESPLEKDEPVASQLAAELLSERTRYEWTATPISKEEYEALYEKGPKPSENLKDIPAGASEIFRLRGKVHPTTEIELFDLPPAVLKDYQDVTERRGKEWAANGLSSPMSDGRRLLGELSVCEASISAVKCDGPFDLHVAGRIQSGVNVFQVEKFYSDKAPTGYWKLNTKALLARHDTFVFYDHEDKFKEVEFIGIGKA